MLIVLEGLDGSGKSTQLALLRDWLDAQGMEPVTIKLPDYGDDSSALVRQYLAGRFGGRPGDVNAYAASLFYAVDRYANYRLKWADKYAAGRVILADRYTTSNACHQAIKLPQGEWPAFFAWLEDTEYGKLGIPRPDLVLYLDMPLEVSRALISARYEGDEARRDIHEADFAYLAACREAALAACGAMGWVRVACAEGGAPFPPPAIHERIRAHVDLPALSGENKGEAT
ncbi:MAG: thymidylate kinase [Oscillospiraceae bacterium]|jgi:dTMP kinase|nr:thymidylate kinase [Oscillospiraceae bacterium]